MAVRRRFSFDYETTVLCPGLLAPPVVCMAYAWDDREVDLVHARTGRRPGFESLRGRNDTIDEILLRALIDDECAMVAYNAQFEAVVTMAHNAWLMPLVFRKARLGLWHCCYLRETQIRIARGSASDEDGNEKDVGTLADVARYYGIDAEVDKSFHGRLRYGTLLDVPISQWSQDFIDYAVGDIVVRDIDAAQRHKAREVEYVDHTRQMVAAINLSLTSCRGFAVDLETARQLVKETEARIERSKEMILNPEKFGFDAPPLAQWKKEKGVYKVSRSKKPATEYITKVYAAMGLEPPRKPPTRKMLEAVYAEHDVEPDPFADERELKRELEEHGIVVQGNISLDAEACEGSRCPLLAAYAEFGQASGVMSRVIRILRAAERGMPVQTAYNVLVDTGRTSARQGTTPEPGEAWTAYGQQIQNLPRQGEEEEE